MQTGTQAVISPCTIVRFVYQSAPLHQTGSSFPFWKFFPVQEVVSCNVAFSNLNGKRDSILIRGPIHIHLTTQNVNLMLCFRTTHPPNITTHNLVPGIFKILGFFTLSFPSFYKNGQREISANSFTVFKYFELRTIGKMHSMTFALKL